MAILQTLLCCLLAPVGAWQYGIIIDAGSGGSRLHLFRWPERVADPLHPQNPAISIPEEVLHVRVEVGISAFAKNVSGLVPYLDELMNHATAQMEPLREMWSLIPIYLKATAGARDLFQDQRDAIFSVIRQYLYQCPFRFETDYWARTISGEEEGVYAWLTVNAIKGTFRSSRKEDTWGSLDMGGASVQLAFIPHDISIIQNFFPLHLSYLSIHLYAHSFLEFGYNAANQRLLQKLLKEPRREGEALRHPCFPTGQQFTQQLREPFFVNKDPIVIRGTGDFHKCMELAEGLLDLKKPCFVPAKSRNFANDSSANGACSIGGTYEPALYTQKFVAMGHFAKIAMSMGLPLAEPVPLSRWRAGMEELCRPGLPFEQGLGGPKFLVEDFVPEGWQPDPMHLPLSKCWLAIWFWTILTKGFHFPVDTKQIMFAHELNGNDVGWALGSMAYDVNYYPWSPALHLGEFPTINAASQPLEAPQTPENWVAAWSVTLAMIGGVACGLMLGMPLGAFCVPGANSLISAGPLRFIRSILGSCARKLGRTGSLEHGLLQC